MNYYTEAIELIDSYAEQHSYDGDLDHFEAVRDELLDRAESIASTLFSWGLTWDYAFWLSARKVVTF